MSWHGHAVSALRPPPPFPFHASCTWCSTTTLTCRTEPQCSPMKPAHGPNPCPTWPQPQPLPHTPSTHLDPPAPNFATRPPREMSPGPDPYPDTSQPRPKLCNPSPKGNEPRPRPRLRPRPGPTQPRPPPANPLLAGREPADHAGHLHPRVHHPQAARHALRRGALGHGRPAAIPGCVQPVSGACALVCAYVRARVCECVSHTPTVGIRASCRSWPRSACE